MKLEKRKLEQIDPIPMKLKRRHRIHIAWTCSDFVHHEHLTKFGAWLCGRRQMIAAFFIQPRDSITEIDKLKVHLELGDEIIEAGANSAGYYLKCSNGKLVMTCLNGDFPVEPVDVPKIAAGYQSVLAIGRWAPVPE